MCEMDKLWLLIVSECPAEMDCWRSTWYAKKDNANPYRLYITLNPFLVNTWTKKKTRIIIIKTTSHKKIPIIFHFKTYFMRKSIYRGEERALENTAQHKIAAVLSYLVLHWMFYKHIFAVVYGAICTQISKKKESERKEDTRNWMTMVEHWQRQTVNSGIERERNWDSDQERVYKHTKRWYNNCRWCNVRNYTSAPLKLTSCLQCT